MTPDNRGHSNSGYGTLQDCLSKPTLELRLAMLLPSATEGRSLLLDLFLRPHLLPIAAATTTAAATEATTKPAATGRAAATLTATGSTAAATLTTTARPNL